MRPSNSRSGRRLSLLGAIQPALLAILYAASATLHGSQVEAANLFGLIDTGELYRSTDGGITWSSHATLPVRDAVGLAASVNASDLTIVTRSGSVYASLDGGVNWSAVGTLTASDVVSFTILPEGSVLALTESGAVYKSTDGGFSFTGLATITASNCVSIVRGPLGRLYTLTRTGEIYESEDSGSNWNTIGTVAVSNAVSIVSKVADLFLLTNTGEIYRSTTYGASWLPVGSITASNMSAMTPSGGTILASARSGEIYRSSVGTSWQAVGAVNQLNVVSLASDEPLATGVPEERTPPHLVVRAPYPNPSRAGVGTFPLSLDRPARVRLELYDVHGRRLAASAEPVLNPGFHALNWTPRGLRTGRYYVRYVVGGDVRAARTWSIVR
jgi:photosystem II stability/assembly factor-like uncharacterized protein